MMHGSADKARMCENFNEHSYLAAQGTSGKVALPRLSAGLILCWS